MRSWLVSFWLIISGWSTYGQSLTRAQLTGIWVGVHTQYGSDAYSYCPLPAYLDLQPDGTYRLGLLDESAPARVATWTINGDTLRLGAIAYAPGLVMLKTDTLRIGTVFPMTFCRFKNVPIDSALVREKLVNRAWQTDSLTVHFHDNGRVCLENRITNQRTVHHWRLSQHDKSVFILIQGSEHTTDGHYKPLWQLMTATVNQFGVTGWKGKRVATETFRLVRSLLPGDSCQPTGFQACDNCFSQRSSYSISVLSPSQQYTVQKISRQYYQPVEQTGESGLIQIRFVVNCAGEMGLFTVTELDENYRTRSFADRITSQLTAICRHQLLRALTADAPVPEDRRDRAITLNFRLKEGHLTDIFP